MRTPLSRPTINRDNTYESTSRTLRWVILALVLATYPNSDPKAVIVFTFTGFMLAFNVLHYSGYILKTKFFSSRLNTLVVDNLYIVTVIALSGGLASPYYPLIFLMIIDVIICYGVAGFAIGLAVQLVLTLIFLRVPQTSLPSDPEYRFIIQLVLLVVFSLVAEQSVRSRDEEYLMETGYTRQVDNERQRLLTLINSLTSAVLAVDHAGKVYLYNAAALELLNTNRDITGIHLADFLKLRDRHNRKIDVLQIAIDAGGMIHRDDLSYTAADDTKMVLDMTISPVRGYSAGQGKSSWGGYMIVFSDITKQKSLEEERDEFVSVTSHELRTPLAIAEANLSTALMPGFAQIDPRATELIQQAHQNILFLGDLVKDLASLSRAERADLHFERTIIDLGDLLDELARDYRPQADTKHLKLVVLGDTQVKRVYTSEPELREMLQNLITNAIKYTLKGSITLELGHNDRGAIVKVKDTGIGISATDKAKVFQKFYRSEDYRTRATGGTGLGLYVTHKLAERLGLTLTFESKLNHGSVFELTVPYYDEPQA